MIATGKETDRLLDQQIGLYRETTEEDRWRDVILPAIRQCSTAQVARITGLSERTIEKAKNSRVPYADNQTKLLMAIGDIKGMLRYSERPSLSRIRYLLEALVLIP
jgi:hypothetical protein